MAKGEKAILTMQERCIGTQELAEIRVWKTRIPFTTLWCKHIRIINMSYYTISFKIYIISIFSKEI